MSKYVSSDAGEHYLFCLSCDSTCLSCSAPAQNDACTSCDPGVQQHQYLQARNVAGESKGYCVEECDVPYSPHNNICTQSDTSTHCVTCRLVNDPQTCRSCAKSLQDHEYLQEIANNSAEGYCQHQCNDGYAIADLGAAAYVCTHCHYSCKTCAIPGEQDHCTSCDIAGSSYDFKYY